MNFRGITAPASLKPAPCGEYVVTRPRFPGHNSPGLIEAYIVQLRGNAEYVISGA